MRPSFGYSQRDGPLGIWTPTDPSCCGVGGCENAHEPLLCQFTAILARNGVAPDWQFGAMPGSKALALVFLAQRKLQRG